MGRRHRKSDFEKAVQALSGLSWQACLCLAIIAFLGFHWLSQIQPPAAWEVGQLGGTIAATMFKMAGIFLQWLAPITLCLAALLSWIGKRRRARLLTEAESRKSVAPIRQLSWKDFEQLVGGYFERKGYAVSITKQGADGGVDIAARKGGETFLVQCKQWRATKVGVSVVRELFGVMAAHGATGAFVVSIGEFTTEARDFASGRNIELIDANHLLTERMAAAERPAERSVTTPLSSCPKCGAAMIRRVAKQGANQGKTFYGCTNFPKCRSTLPDSS
jgi:restriction system protein